MIQQFTGGVAASGGGTATGGGATAGGASGGTAAGGSAAGGGMAAAAPWLGLAAVIAGNEYTARKDGRRSSDDSEYLKELASGAVGFQDGEAIADELGPIGAPLEDLSRFGEKWAKKLMPWEWW